MTVPTGVITHGVKDCKLFPITADSLTAYTCGAGIDIPVISIDYNFEMDEKELRQDNETSDVYTETKKITIKLTSGTFSLDVMKALFGGTLVSSGVSPAGVQTYGYKLGKVDNYAQLACLIDYTGTLSGAADMHLHFMKCKINEWSFKGNDGEYGDVSISVTGINSKYQFSSATNALAVTINETGAALAAIVSP